MINKYIAAVLCGLFLLAGHLPAAQAEADFNISEAINKAGRQRMLTQRIVKSYLQMGQIGRAHVISYAVFCLKKKIKYKKNNPRQFEAIGH